MKVLLLEDDRNYAPILEESLRQLGPDVNVSVVLSRDSCVAAATSEEYDLAIIDLRVPSGDENLDTDTSHGLDAFRKIRQILPGTPVILHSAYGTIEILEDVLKEGTQEDLLGFGPHPMLQSIRKGPIALLADLVEGIHIPLRELDAIDVKAEQALDPPMSELERRVLRIHGRRYGGVLVLVEPMIAGLSDTRVLKARVENQLRVTRSLAVAKIGPLELIQREHQNYQTFSAPLPHPTVPQLSDLVRAGAGRQGGLFYAVAEGYESLFALLGTDVEKAASAVRNLEHALEPWWSGAPFVSRTVGEVREELAGSETERELLGDWRTAETIAFQATRCPRHGDLHGANVLVDPSGVPILIDFARTGHGEAALDPVTLELSVLFHPDAAPLRSQLWPSFESAAHWPDLDEFVKGSTLEPYLRACREWAERVALPRENYAVGYAYAVRQLLFEDTDRALAEALAGSAIAALRSS